MWSTRSDLSKCELMQIPDAVYHLMRNTELQTCNLSGNVLKSVSPIFSQKFSVITGLSCLLCLFAPYQVKIRISDKCNNLLTFSDLNLSNNKLTRLPEELNNLTRLTRLNISHNSFIVLPQVVFKLQSLAHLDAQHNAILGKRCHPIIFYPHSLY